METEKDEPNQHIVHWVTSYLVMLGLLPLSVALKSSHFEVLGTKTECDWEDQEWCKVVSYLD